MQTMKLLIDVCNHVDKLNRKFLQGDTNTEKKIHLVNWNYVCNLKGWAGWGVGGVLTIIVLSITNLGGKNEHKPKWIQLLKVNAGPP